MPAATSPARNVLPVCSLRAKNCCKNACTRDRSRFFGPHSFLSCLSPFLSHWGLMEPQIQLPSAYSSAPFSQRVKDLVGRVKAERLAGPSIEQAPHLRHRRTMDCREIRVFGKEVSDETIPVLVHPAFPLVIGGGKEDLGAQTLGGFPVSSELLPVIVRDRMDLDAQGFEPMHCPTVRRLGRGPGEPRRR